MPWDFYIGHECLADTTDPRTDTGRLPWPDPRTGYGSRLLAFSTAPGAQRPDIEAVAGACPERRRRGGRG